MPQSLPESLRTLADLLEDPQDGWRLGYLAQHLLGDLDACRAGLVDALVEGSERMGIPRPLREGEREMHALPTRREAHEDAFLDQELNRAYRDYLATDPEDVQGRALARLYVERAVQERYPLVSTKTPVIMDSGMAPAVWNPARSDAGSILDILVPLCAAIIVMLLVALCVSLFSA